MSNCAYGCSPTDTSCPNYKKPPMTDTAKTKEDFLKIIKDAEEGIRRLSELKADLGDVLFNGASYGFIIQEQTYPIKYRLFTLSNPWFILTGAYSAPTLAELLKLLSDGNWKRVGNYNWRKGIPTNG